MLKNFFWITPFLCFFAGYQIINLLTQTDVFPAPSLVGLPIGQAIKILSEHRLNARIMMEKDEWDLPEGTVLSQTPRAHHRVKAQQPVFLVLAKKPRKQAPDIRTRSLSDAQALAEHASLRLKTYLVPTSYPAQTCVAQFPSPGQVAQTNKMIAYVSSGAKKPQLFPDLRNLAVGQVAEWLKAYPATITAVHTRPLHPDHYCNHCIIVEQKPLPGTIIEIDKPFVVRVEVD
jgi:beta-lactam-binding protein with PASTA domain